MLADENITINYTQEMFDQLVMWIEAWYQGIKVKVLKTLKLDNSVIKKVENKKNEKNEVQLNGNEFIKNILVPIHKQHQDSIGVICFTDVDLYTKGCYNFCYGCANYSLQGSVQSSARKEKSNLRGFLKTATHEIGHMFGLRHCTYH